MAVECLRRPRFAPWGARALRRPAGGDSGHAAAPAETRERRGPTKPLAPYWRSAAHRRHLPSPAPAPPSTQVTRQPTSPTHASTCEHAGQRPSPTTLRPALGIDEVKGSNSVPLPDLMGRYSKRSTWASGLPGSRDVTTEPQSGTPRSRRTSGKKLSTTEVALLAQQYQSGAAVHELAERLGIHRNTVSLHLRRHGVTMRRRGLDPEHIDHAVRLYESGQSLARIGNRYSVDPSTVHAALRTRGVRLRDTHGRDQ